MATTADKPVSDKMTLYCRLLAQALTWACNEHGRPNSFSADELSRLYGAPGRMMIGRLSSQQRYRLEVHRALVEEFGWRGTAPQYSEGRFYV